MLTNKQIDSLERVVLKLLLLADKSPNTASVLGIEKEDAASAKAAIERLKKMKQ